MAAVTVVLGGGWQAWLILVGRLPLWLLWLILVATHRGPSSAVAVVEVVPESDYPAFTEPTSYLCERGLMSDFSTSNCRNGFILEPELLNFKVFKCYWALPGF